MTQNLERLTENDVREICNCCKTSSELVDIQNLSLLEDAAISWQNKRKSLETKVGHLLPAPRNERSFVNRQEKCCLFRQTPLRKRPSSIPVPSSCGCVFFLPKKTTFLGVSSEDKEEGWPRRNRFVLPSPRKTRCFAPNVGSLPDYSGTDRRVQDVWLSQQKRPTWCRTGRNPVQFVWLSLVHPFEWNDVDGLKRPGFVFGNRSLTTEHDMLKKIDLWVTVSFTTRKSVGELLWMDSVDSAQEKKIRFWADMSLQQE